MVITAASSCFGSWVARASATPTVTAVPRDCPTRAMREEGIPRELAKRKAVRPSSIRPDSEGTPEERPKPR